MQPLNIILSAIICILGIVFGVLLGIIAKEELKDGRKWFLLMQGVIFVFILFFIFKFYMLNIIYIILISVFVLLVMFFVTDIRREIIVYSICAIVFYLSIQNTNLFLIESSLIFLYGLPTGSLVYEKWMTKIRDKL